MRFRTLLLITVLTAGLVISAQCKTLNVMDFGAAGDGKKDDTAAFQKALDSAGKAGGIVHAPKGSYLIKGNLSIPSGVTLEGSYTSVPAHAGIRDAGRLKPGEDGTTLLAVAGKGSEEGTPFISLTSNSTLKGLVIYYPEQRPDDVPYPYPWTVQMRGHNPAILDVELLNPYQAIDATGNSRHLIRNVHGQPLRKGVFVDSIYDIGRIENVHWNPWWSMQPKLFNWQMENGEAFIFARTDWQYVLNTFCYGYRVGYKFYCSKSGVTNGNFLGIGADRCVEAVVIDECSPIGLLITNGEFVSFDGKEPTQIRVKNTNTGKVRFVNCSFWGNSRQIASIEGRGTVGFSDCIFTNWDMNKEGRAAIQAESGTVLLRGCDFRIDAPQVYLGPEIQRAVISDNVVMGDVRITNDSKGNVSITGNVGTGQK